MHLRPYRPEDLPTLRAITAEAFDGVSIDQGIEKQFGVINGRDWNWRKGRHVDADVARDADGVLVAELDGRIIGMVSTFEDREAGIGHISNIVLTPDQRNRGLGRTMLEHVMHRFREHGLTHAKIETLVQNARGAHLYESLGFREVARQIHFVAKLD